MKSQNELLSKMEFEHRISGLPCKQQLAVRACFDASMRKSAKGMKYTDKWLLECILMRMKSPKLYEHIRRHKILPLPGRTCLPKHTFHFKSGFGFNSNIFVPWRPRLWRNENFRALGCQINRWKGIINQQLAAMLKSSKAIFNVLLFVCIFQVT